MRGVELPERVKEWTYTESDIVMYSEKHGQGPTFTQFGIRVLHPAEHIKDECRKAAV